MQSTPEAARALGEAFGGSSALLKHEVAYVLGQMLHEAAIPFLRHACQQLTGCVDLSALRRGCSGLLTPSLVHRRVLKDADEHVMVRHEAAEALGAIADPGCISLLEAHCQDSEPVVADSCRVALDMLAHEHSGAFQYAQ